MNNSGEYEKNLYAKLQCKVTCTTCGKYDHKLKDC